MLAEFCSHCMFFINWETDSWFLSSLSAQINYTYFRRRDLCKLAGWLQCGSPSASLVKLHPGPASKKWKPVKTQLGSLPLSGKLYHSNSYSCTMKISRAAGSLSLVTLPNQIGPVLELLCHSCWQPLGSVREMMEKPAVHSAQDSRHCQVLWGCVFKSLWGEVRIQQSMGPAEALNAVFSSWGSALVSGLAMVLQTCQGGQNLARVWGPWVFQNQYFFPDRRNWKERHWKDLFGSGIYDLPYAKAFKEDFS